MCIPFHFNFVERNVYVDSKGFMRVLDAKPTYALNKATTTDGNHSWGQEWNEETYGSQDATLDR